MKGSEALLRACIKTDQEDESGLRADAGAGTGCPINAASASFDSIGISLQADFT